MDKDSIIAKIELALASVKQEEFEILPPTEKWYRWRNGRIPPACTVLGAVLLFYTKDNGPGGRNWIIPNPSSWLHLTAEVLGVDLRWVLIFLRAQGDSGARDVPYHPFDEDDAIAYSIGEQYRI